MLLTTGFKMTAKILKIVICSLCGMALATAQTEPRSIRWQTKFTHSRYMRGVIVLPPDQLSTNVAEQIGRVALKENPECTFVHVEIFPENNYPPFHYLLLSHVGYDW